MYTQDYKLSLNNGYLTYHFENNIEEILLVKKIQVTHTFMKQIKMEL